jgi:hypothetical protein
LTKISPDFLFCFFLLFYICNNILVMTSEKDKLGLSSAKLRQSWSELHHFDHPTLLIHGKTTQMFGI